jgi:hypothetical protein
VPLRLDKICLAAELEAAVNLLTSQPEGRLGREALNIEQILQELLERVAACLRGKR